jgi:hypothetical protein
MHIASSPSIGALAVFGKRPCGLDMALRCCGRSK